MRSLAAFLVINGLFIAMNAAFALAILGVFKLMQWIWPEAMESPLFVLILGTAVLVGVLWAFSKIISPRRSRN